MGAAVDASRVASQFFTIFLGRACWCFGAHFRVHLQHEGPSQSHSRKHNQQILWNEVIQALRKHATSTLLLGDRSLLLSSFYSDTNKGNAKFRTVFRKGRHRTLL